MESNARLCSVEGKDLEDAIIYRQLVGSLPHFDLTWHSTCNWYSQLINAEAKETTLVSNMSNSEVCQKYHWLWNILKEKCAA